MGDANFINTPVGSITDIIPEVKGPAPIGTVDEVSDLGAGATQEGPCLPTLDTAEAASAREGSAIYINPMVRIID